MKHLLKKEISELMNKQFLLSLLVTFVMLIVIGLVMNTTMTETLSQVSGELHIIDSDCSVLTDEIVDSLEQDGYKVCRIFCDEADAPDCYITEMERSEWSEAVVFPKGFSEQLAQKTPAQLRTLTVLHSTSSLQYSLSQGETESVVRTKLQQIMMKQELGDAEAFLAAPAEMIPYTIANGKIAQTDGFAIISSMTLYDMLMPLTLFMLVILTCQTIITAIGAEKTDKTLETLLSSPASRLHILEAKMLAALLVAVVYALTCCAGFLAVLLMNVSQTAATVDIGDSFASILLVRKAVETLELGIPAAGWLLIFGQLILTIGISLVASLILGAFVQDAKGAQTASLPILMATMFPYLLSMVSDIRQMGIVVRIVMYLIPFTHTFIATNCLRFHDYPLAFGGLIYQAVFLLVMVLLALKIYHSDILFTSAFRRPTGGDSPQTR